MEALTTGWNLLLIVAGFALLIALHELGHFLAARWAGIRVHVFALGMGPVVCSFRRGIGACFGSTERVVSARFGMPASRMSDAELAKHGLGETEYSLRILPIGGFVGMLGQDDFDPSARSDDPRSYQRTSIGRRMVVVSAGVIANLIVAIVLFVIAFMVGVRFEAPVLGSVVPEGPAARARPIGSEADAAGEGLRRGDRVLSIDGTDMLTYADIRIAAAMSRPGVPLTIAVERPGVPHTLLFSADPLPEPGAGLRSLMVSPSFDAEISTDPRTDPQVREALVDAGLGASPLAPGWTLRGVNGRSADGANDLFLAAGHSRGAPVSTSWRAPGARDDIQVEIPVRPLLDRYEVGVGSDGAPIFEQGFLGLLPLARIAGVESDSENKGVLLPGDVVLRAGETPGPSFSDLSRVVRGHGAGSFPMLVLRDGKETEITATITAPGALSGGSPRLGVQLEPALDLPLTAAPIASATPASNLGILPLSTLRSLDGAPIERFEQLRELATKALSATGPNAPAALELVVISPTPGRERRTLSLPISPAEHGRILGTGWAPSLSEFVFDPLQTTLTADGNPLRAIAMGFRQTHRMVLLTYLTLDRLFRGTVAVKELHGPVGIVHVGTRVADRGFMYLVFFLAMISVNLAVLNFLPLPIVDGGLFLFLVYEKIRGKPPSVAFQNAATVVGLFLIVGVFLLASYNDVMRLIGRL